MICEPARCNTSELATATVGEFKIHEARCDPARAELNRCSRSWPRERVQCNRTANRPPGKGRYSRVFLAIYRRYFDIFREIRGFVACIFVLNDFNHRVR